MEGRVFKHGQWFAENVWLFPITKSMDDPRKWLRVLSLIFFFLVWLPTVCFATLPYMFVVAIAAMFEMI